MEFDGEYKNGERNGKGKEFYGNGEIRFNGEYLYGKRWNGKKIEYNDDEDNDELFEVEYFNGERKKKKVQN